MKFCEAYRLCAEKTSCHISDHTEEKYYFMHFFKTFVVTVLSMLSREVYHVKDDMTFKLYPHGLLCTYAFVIPLNHGIISVPPQL